MADGYSICTKCSWINKIEDLSCNACGASLPRASTPFVPTASTAAAAAVQPPFQPSYPVTVNPSVYVPSQTNSYSTRPQQSSTYSYTPTSPTRPSTMQSYTDQSASSNSYSSPTRPYVAAPSNAQAFYPQPSAPCESSSSVDFGSKQSSVPVAASNYPSTGSYVPSNANSTTHAHYETSTFVNSTAPVNRPSEPVDDFASGFGTGTSYSSGNHRNHNLTPSLGSQVQSTHQWTTSYASVPEQHKPSHYGHPISPTTRSEPIDDFVSGFGKGSCNRNAQYNAFESQMYDRQSTSFGNPNKNHGMMSALPSSNPQTRLEPIDNFASGFGNQTATREYRGTQTNEGMMKPTLF